MEDQPSAPQTPLGFVSRHLPWVIAGVALLVYLATVNRWVRLESLVTVARTGGWEMAPTFQAPLYYLLTLPVSWLPVSIQPLTLNLLSVVLGAAAMGLLARSVAVLPFDRTRETRLRERGAQSRLSTPAAWVPVVLATGLCGLQLTFWEHATAATGELLDLFLFSFLIWLLLEYRLDRREGRLTLFAVVYGVAVTNNYAMIAFFPAFAIAVMWIKGWESFQVAFFVRLGLAGLAGLLMYLALPIASALKGDAVLSFQDHFKAILSMQKANLGALPVYRVLLLALSSLIPVLLTGIRWPSSSGDTSVAGATLNTTLLRFVQAVLLVLCITVFFDPRWSPRQLGVGLALLPLYYLGAIGVAYFTGYFMVLTRPPMSKIATRSRTMLEGMGGGVIGVAVLAAVALPGWLAVRDYPIVRMIDGRYLSQMADWMVRPLPAQGAYMFSDVPAELLLMESRLRQANPDHKHVLVHAGSLEYLKYHDQLKARYGSRWPDLRDRDKVREPVDQNLLLFNMTALCRSNAVYYSNPSFGYYFEMMHLIPYGISYRLEVYPKTTLIPGPIDPGLYTQNQKFWESAEPVLLALASSRRGVHSEVEYVRRHLGRALNWWAVLAQRSGHATEATYWFELALRVSPGNVSARVNLEYNEQLVKKAAPSSASIEMPDTKAQYSSWDAVMLVNGPFDHPKWCALMGETMAAGSLYRQALIEFARAQALEPTNVPVAIWRMNMESMTRFGLGDVSGAEKQALETHSQYPQDESSLESLTQIYFLTARITNALATVEKQLRINPDSPRALLNMAAFNIQLGQFDKAIAPLDKLLQSQPNNAPGRLNRAIAHLQTDNLDLAQRDYETLLDLMPESPAVYFGLGETAFRRKDSTRALAHFETYLKYADPTTEEYKRILQRVKDLRKPGGLP